VLESRVDHTRVVLMLRKAGNLPLVKDYLMSVQKTNLSAVNEAVNELLIEEEDFEVRPRTTSNHVHGVLVFPRLRGPWSAQYSSPSLMVVRHALLALTCHVERRQLCPDVHEAI